MSISINIRNPFVFNSSTNLRNNTINSTDCVIYSQTLTLYHRVVQVQLKSIQAYATIQDVPYSSKMKLKYQQINKMNENGENNYISYGLTSVFENILQSYSRERLDIQIYPYNDSSLDDTLMKAKKEEYCNCMVGEAESVCIVFLHREKPHYTIIKGIKQVIYALICNIMLWEGRLLKVNWFGQQESIQIENIECNKASTGCCYALSQLSINMKSRGNIILKWRPTHKEIQEGNNKVVINKNLSSTSFDTNVIPSFLASLSDTMGGVETYAEKIFQAALKRLFPEQYKSNYQQGQTVLKQQSLGCILYGVPGIGKTKLAQEASNILVKHFSSTNGVQIEAIRIHAPDIFQTDVGADGTSENTPVEQLNLVFTKLYNAAPSILILDNIEVLVGSRFNSGERQEKAYELRLLGTFLAGLEMLQQSMTRCFVIATTSADIDSNELDSAVTSNGRLDVHVSMNPPDQPQRYYILRTLSKMWDMNDALSHDSLLHNISCRTNGFVAADLLNLSREAVQKCAEICELKSLKNVTLSLEHFEYALTICTPSVLQNHDIQRIVKSSTATKLSNLLFEGVYGHPKAKQVLQASLFKPLIDVQNFLAFGISPPRGILIHGPSGSGKSHLVATLAKEIANCGLATFISVQASDIISSVVGDSEKKLHDLFKTARLAAPCVLVFDQIEAIAPVRGFDSSTEQTFDRLLSILLVEMDGFNNSNSGFHEHTMSQAMFLSNHVVVVGITTNPKELDPSILRPGRFDVQVPLSLLDENGRRELIQDLLQTLPIEYTVQDSEVEIMSNFVNKTSGFLAGEIQAVFHEAAVSAMRKNINSDKISVELLYMALDKHVTTKYT